MGSTDLGLLVGASTWSEARDVNDYGKVVGFIRTRDHASLTTGGRVWWKDETGRWHTEKQGNTKDIHGINNESEMALTDDQYFAKRISWKSERNGRLYSPRLQPIEQEPRSEALGINDPGDVVGYIGTEDTTYAFITSRKSNRDYIF